MGGGRFANCSMLEAIKLCEEITGRPLDYSYDEVNRIGDHIWWISDTSRFERDYPGWGRSFDLRRTLEEIHAAIVERRPRRP
jgi:CDP-paratose 2-epimerase